jgi:uncharacterized membrane protein
MATLTVFIFSTPEGAEKMIGKVQALQKVELIKIQDAAMVSRLPGKKSLRPNSWSTWLAWVQCKVHFGACYSV